MKLALHSCMQFSGTQSLLLVAPRKRLGIQKCLKAYCGMTKSTHLCRLPSVSRRNLQRIQFVLDHLRSSVLFQALERNAADVIVSGGQKLIVFQIEEETDSGRTDTDAGDRSGCHDKLSFERFWVFALARILDALFHFRAVVALVHCMCGFENKLQSATCAQAIDPCSTSCLPDMNPRCTQVY